MKRFFISLCVSMSLALSTPLWAKTKTWQDSRASIHEVKDKKDISKIGVKYNLSVIFDHTENGHKTLRFLLTPEKEQSNCDLKTRAKRGEAYQFTLNNQRISGILVCQENPETRKKSLSIYPSSWTDRKHAIEQFKASNNVEFSIERLVFVVPADGFTKSWSAFSK